MSSKKPLPQKTLVITSSTKYYWTWAHKSHTSLPCPLDYFKIYFGIIYVQFLSYTSWLFFVYFDSSFRLLWPCGISKILGCNYRICSICACNFSSHIIVNLIPFFRFRGGNLHSSRKCSGSWESWFPHNQIIEWGLRTMNWRGLAGN